MGNKSSKSELKSSFTWKLPKLTKINIDLLCKGFINQYTRNLYIPADIIKLCIDYFNDNIEIESLRKTKNTECFKSCKPFTINQFKFYLDIYPNGYDTSSDGYCDVLLNILSIPPNIGRVRINYNISLLELNISSSQVSTFNRSNIGYVWNEKIKFDKIKSLKTLTFILNITKLKIFYIIQDLIDEDNGVEDRGNNDLMQETKGGKTEKISGSDKILINSDFELLSDEYLWNITQLEIKNGASSALVSSPLFTVGSFKWMMQICKMTDGLDGIILSLVALSSNIWTVYIHWEMELAETRKHNENEPEIMNKRKLQGSSELHANGLYHVICPHIDIRQMLKAQVNMKITIIDVFDQGGNGMNDKYDAFQNDKIQNNKSKFIWNIIKDDIQLLTKMKTCPFGAMFVSPVFMVNGCHWCLRFYPNGYDVGDYDGNIDINTIKSNIDNTACLMLNCVATPPDIDSISVIFELVLKQTDTKGLEHQTFQRDSFWGWEQKNIDILPYDELTFILNITVIDVYDKDGKPITSSECDKYDGDDQLVDGDGIRICKKVDMNQRRFLWEIKDENKMKVIKNEQEKNDGQIIMSQIFGMYGMKWYLELHPIEADGDDIKNDENDDDNDIEHTFHIFLSLATKSPKIESVAFGFGLLLKETGTAHWHYGQLFGEELSIGTDEMSPKKSVLSKLDTLTIELYVNLFEVYDKNSNLVTHKFIDNNVTQKGFEEATLLIHGYSRNVTLPSFIIKLCFDYFYVAENENDDEIPMAKELDFIYGDYKWYIDDNKLMKKIKKSKQFESFSSEIFIINGFKFMIQICPNGSHLDNKGKFEWFLCLVSIPPSISKVSVIYEVELEELGVKDNYRMELSLKCTSYGWGTKKLKFNEISKLKQLTFKLKVGIIDVYDENGETVTNKYIHNVITQRKPMLLQDFVWKVKDRELLQEMKLAKNMQSFKSEIFEQDVWKWNLLFYPNGAKKKQKGECVLYLNLIEFPFDVAGISIYFELYVKETGTIWSYCTHLRSNKLCEGWETCRIKLKDILGLRKLTFSAIIYLIDVYDTNSNLVTNKYVNSTQIN